MKKAEQLELRTRLDKIVETAILKEGTCPSHSDFLGCARALSVIAAKQIKLIDEENDHWHKLGVGWDSAFSPRYKEAKEILETIERELPNAIEENTGRDSGRDFSSEAAGDPVMGQT